MAPFPNTPKMVLCMGDKRLIGFRREYCMQGSNGVLSTVFPTGSSKNRLPLAVNISDDQLLVCRDSLGLFIGLDGKPRRKYGLPWSEPPSKLCITYPYVIALLKRSLNVKLLFGQLDLSQTLYLDQDETPSFFATTSNNNVYIATSGKPPVIYKLTPVPVTDQIEILKSNHKFVEALSICEHAEEEMVGKKETITELKTLLAYDTFAMGDYRESIALMRTLPSIDPRNVMALFALLPDRIQNEYFPPEISDPEALLGTDYFMY